MSRRLYIDPGPEESAVLEFMPYTRLDLEHYPPGNIVMVAQAPNDAIRQIITGDNVSVVVIEDVVVAGIAGRSTFDTCKAIGEFRLIARVRGIGRVEEMTRPTVKSYICGSTRADDKAVREDICKMFGVDVAARGKNKGPLKDISTHLWPALALAVADNIKQREKARTEQKEHGNAW